MRACAERVVVGQMVEHQRPDVAARACPDVAIGNSKVSSSSRSSRRSRTSGVSANRGPVGEVITLATAAVNVARGTGSVLHGHTRSRLRSISPARSSAAKSIVSSNAGTQYRNRCRRWPTRPAAQAGRWRRRRCGVARLVAGASVTARRRPGEDRQCDRPIWRGGDGRERMPAPRTVEVTAELVHRELTRFGGGPWVEALRRPGTRYGDGAPLARATTPSRRITSGVALR